MSGRWGVFSFVLLVFGLHRAPITTMPAVVDKDGLHPQAMAPLPEAIAAMIRIQGSIQQLIVEAYAERSRTKLFQAILLDPTVKSYRGAVAMMNELLRLQKDLLPVFE